MLSKEIKDLQFVKIQGEDLSVENIGIVLCRSEAECIAYIGFADMEDNFGTWEQPFDKLVVLNEEEIREKLLVIAENKRKYPYFIIQLNDIEELSSYHIEEDDYIKNIRDTNDICLYCKELKVQQ